MGRVTFEDSITIKKFDQDTYQSLHYPFWTWPNSKVVPGGTLISLATAAAYETVPEDFVIDTLHTYFLAGPKHTAPVVIKVQRINISGRFATRAVTLYQENVPLVHVTCSFVRTNAMGGPTMTHSVQRATTQQLEKITLDDLEPATNSQGPIMKFQRLPLVYTGVAPTPSNPPPESMTYTSVATISPAITSRERRVQALGIIMLSDYHILDAPPTLHGIPLTQPAIGDYTRKPVDNRFERFTSLNHTIRFHLHEGFRADELTYMEVNNPWTERRRAEVHSRIFAGDGMLIATVVQGSYFVMKDVGNERNNSSRL